ncbi:MAG: T9SS type A sorting domain-containing protein [Bacteroidota bacterium]
MFKKFLTMLIVLTISVSAVSFSGAKEKRRVIASGASEIFNSEVMIPSVQAAKSFPVLSKSSATPAEGVRLGTSDYDYGWNNGWSRQIAVYGNGSDIHMTYMERDVSQASPANRRTQKYVYYKTSDGSMVSGYPRPKATAATGFGGIDVISNGDAANIAVMTYHVPVNFAIDGAPGTAQFSETTLPFGDAVNDPEITWDAGRQTLWMYDSKGRIDFQISKSTDLGSTWELVDTLLGYAPAAYRDQAVGNSTLDHPLLVAPNGDLILAVGLLGTGALPPAGSAHADSADQIGLFRSTDAGNSWTWESWGKDGDKLVVGTDTVYALYENFGQFTATVDANNKVHMVVNGYTIKVINDSTSSTYFYTLYRSTGMTGWKVISNPADAHIADFDSNYNTGTTNGLGWCYPTISVDTNGVGVFAAWSQYRVAGGKLDTALGSYAQYDLYYSYSGNGGSSWSTPTKWSNTQGGIFANASAYMTHDGANSRTAHVIYLLDSIPGTVTGASAVGAGVVQVPYIYRTVTFNLTSVPQNEAAPVSFELAQNYPNPFNPATTINFSLSKGANVSLKVFNMLGQEVATLVNGFNEAGSHSVSFNGAKLASGVYLYKLQAGNLTETKKMVLTK